MSIVLLAIFAIPPAAYAAVYATYSIKRRKKGAALGICALAAAALCLAAWAGIAGG